MTARIFAARPARGPRKLAWSACALLLSAPLVALSPASHADGPENPLVAEGNSQPASDPNGQPATTTPTTTVSTEGTSPVESPADYGGSLSVSTSVGLGTFVAEPQNASVVTTSFAGSAYYNLAKNLKLTAGLSLTWYQILDVDTSLPENTALLSDLSIGVSHGRIFHDDDSGFNLAGALRISLPTSLASQFQNRLFTLSTSLSASIPVGPVTFSYSLAFGKYFNLTATPTLNCDDFDDPEQCIEGRPGNPNFGYESERRGPEVYLRGAGATSFYLQNSLNISWSIIEDLSLSLGLAISNSYGVRSYEVDDLSGEKATAGRSHRDRLVSSLALEYSFNKYLSAGLSLTTDTSQPFGAQGDDFPVIFDFTRASDNITSLDASVTGSF